MTWTICLILMPVRAMMMFLSPLQTQCQTQSLQHLSPRGKRLQLPKGDGQEQHQRQLKLHLHQQVKGQEQHQRLHQQVVVQVQIEHLELHEGVQRHLTWAANFNVSASC